MAVRPTAGGRRRWAVRLPGGDRRSRRARRTVGAVVVAGLALAHLAIGAAAPIAGGPRPPLSITAPIDRWTPPAPTIDNRFATFPFAAPGGQPGLWNLATGAVPLRFAVEQEVVDRFGIDELEHAISVWNDVPGSRFGAQIERITDTGVTGRRRDGVHRIFIDRRSCGGRYLARAHLWPGDVVVRHSRAVRYIAEVDIGVCDRMRPQQLELVFRHELAHIAGLDHLCDEGEDCHVPTMDADNRCRVMSPRAHPCREIAQGDLDGLVHLHPRLPRAAGGDGRTTSASVALATHPVPRSVIDVVATPYDAAVELQVAAAVYAGHLGVPHLLIDEDCTGGTGGRALDRVLALAGTVQLVGPVTRGCEAALDGAWSVGTRRLPDLEAVEDATLEELPEPERLVVAPITAPARSTPIAAVAAPAAVALGASLMVIGEDEGPDRVLATLEATETVREVIVVGGPLLVDPRTVAAIADAGVTVRRLEANNAGDAVMALAGVAEIAPATNLAVAITAAEHRPHAVAAIGMAVAAGGLLLPIDSELRPDHAQLLRDRVTRGVIVGGLQAIGSEQQMALSRLVDGVDDPALLAPLRIPDPRLITMLQQN